MQLTVTGPTANATLNSATGGGQSPTSYPYVNNGDGTATVTVPDSTSGRMWLTWQGYDAVAYEWSDDTADMADAVWQYYIGDPPDHASTLLATMHDWLFSLMGDGWQNADTVHAVKLLADAIKLKTDQLAFADGKIVTDGTVDVDAIAQAVAAVVPDVDPATIASAVVSALGPQSDPLASKVPSDYAPGTAGFALGKVAPGSVEYSDVITMADGSPVIGAAVRAYLNGELVQSVTTRDDGGFTLYLDAGTYEMHATSDEIVEVVSTITVA